MFSRPKICLFLFLLSHSNSFIHTKRQDKNLEYPKLQNHHDTTELYNIIRWKSQPVFYAASVEYQEIADDPSTEESMTDKSTNIVQNLTVQYWTPIFTSSTATPSSEIADIFNEPQKEHELYEHEHNEHDHYEHESKDDEHKTTRKQKVVEITNTTFEAIIKEDTKEICPHFVFVKQTFDLEPMADIWQTVFFSLPSKIQCFKIMIKRITDQEKKQYSRKYGSFNGIVNWAECNLEIWAATQNGRRHFLQGLNEDDGIMDNIIIEDPEASDTTSGAKLNAKTVAVIHEESADQWLVYKNLLLLRDCDNGGVVVFIKVPAKPSKTHIVEALKVFGETTFNGKMACEEEEEK
ncbi:uncharacterized protein LOC113237861 isoform X2 [Hyposmocoma kahamanoa]|uniref:uncharacterized protein LOC113237861 isoform X2 n=1 Tax=Hyposmocoma kahamanoa TaxID=1477025 RepID=UPI000E6DA15E|nr:uncharacterized protein LOC113237861 isoform X2 [Hyposmocoma kahamanoa]